MARPRHATLSPSRAPGYDHEGSAARHGVTPFPSWKTRMRRPHGDRSLYRSPLSSDLRVGKEGVGGSDEDDSVFSPPRDLLSTSQSNRNPFAPCQQETEGSYGVLVNRPTSSFHLRTLTSLSPSDHAFLPRKGGLPGLGSCSMDLSPVPLQATVVLRYRPARSRQDTITCASNSASSGCGR